MNNDWQLHLGDCIEGMRQLADSSVDVTITDPPYEAEAHTKQRRQKGVHRVVGREEYRAVNAAPLSFVPITPELRRDVALEIARVTRHCALVFCQVEAVIEWKRALTVHGMKYRRTTPWVKPDAMPSLHGRWPGQAFEAIVIATKTGGRPCPIGGKAISYTCVRDKFGHGGVEKCPHPTTKPLALMRDLVNHFSLEGDLVLDPFAGSGTTGVACKQLGRSFIGYELDVNYHAIAQRRIAGEAAREHVSQLDLLAGVGQ